MGIQWSLLLESHLPSRQPSWVLFWIPVGTLQLIHGEHGVECCYLPRQLPPLPTFGLFLKWIWYQSMHHNKLLETKVKLFWAVSFTSAHLAWGKGPRLLSLPSQWWGMCVWVRNGCDQSIPITLSKEIFSKNSLLSWPLQSFKYLWGSHYVKGFPK